MRAPDPDRRRRRTYHPPAGAARALAAAASGRPRFRRAAGADGRCQHRDG